MRGWRRLLVTGTVLGIACSVGMAGTAFAQPVPPGAAGPGGTVNVNVFFNALSPYGAWQQSSRWGWVWYPNTVPAGWRPYTHGHWVLTDDGWTWLSAWDWGWGPFHYGRWFDDPDLGWLWVPGAVWGPAWVMWEQGDDYIGWAPLPPEVGWSWGVGLEFGNMQLESMLPPGAFVFVRDNDFTDRDLRRFIVPRARSVIILPRTHVVTRYEAENGRVIDRGIPPEFLERRLGHRIPRYRVEGVESPERLGRGDRYEHGGGVMFYRPHVREGERFEPPQERFALPFQPFEELQRRQDEQRRELEQRHQEEQQQLERLHNQERERPPEGMRPEELQRRQDQERQFMRGEQERENHQMERRQGQERQRYQEEQQRRGGEQEHHGGEQEHHGGEQQHHGGEEHGGEHHGGGGGHDGH